MIIVKTTIHGQDSKILLGIDIQPTISSLYGSEYLEDYDRRISCSFGFSIDYIVSERNIIKSGIYYDRKGVKTDVYVGTDSRIYPGSALTVTYDYISVPFLETLTTKGKTKFFITVGPSIGYLTSHKWIIKPANRGEEMKIDITEEANKFDIGFTFGGGIAIYLTEKLHLNIELRDNIGLIDTNKQENYVEKTKICGLLLGLRIRS